MKDEFKLESEIGVTLDLWNDLYLNSGVYSAIFSELVCVISKYPKVIHRNTNGALHNLDGQAIEWGCSADVTNWTCYYINGRNIPEHLFVAIKNKSLAADLFFKEGNEEVKSACIAMMQDLYGEEYVFNFFRESLKEVDTYVNKKEERFLIGTTGGMNIGVYTLFKGEINDEDVAYIRCYCPSTDRMFFLGVDPKHTNAKDAIASLYRVPKKLKNHIKYISRQGERFSTVFDDKGTEMLKQNLLSKEDISDTTTISGDRYFKLMQYEY